MMGYNPIYSVTPIDFEGNATGATITGLPCPSVFEYNLHDVSGSEAGRLESLTMNKMRKGQSRSVPVRWELPTLAEAASVLWAFNSEYVRINFLDALTGGFIDRNFYVSDRQAPIKNTNLGRWEYVSFTIIQQTADVV